MAGGSKAELRRHYRRVRREAMATAQAPMTRVGMAALPLALPVRVTQGRRLGLYWPIGAEPDLRAVADALSAALPVVEGERLLYRPWQPGASLAPDACGIPAPAAGAALDPEQLAVLLVPALALDGQGIRLGSGGGWYDRLRADPAWRAVPALAVLPAACLTGELPRDAWDVPFDGWLDEHGLHWR